MSLRPDFTNAPNAAIPGGSTARFFGLGCKLSLLSFVYHGFL